MIVNVGKRLLAQRNRKNLSGGQVATYLGITPTHVSNMEKGKRRPSLELLARLARYFGCSTDYLLGLTEDPSPAGEASEIQVLFGRLSVDGQRRALALVETLLADEDEAYELELVMGWLERTSPDAARALRGFIDDEMDEMDEEES